MENTFEIKNKMIVAIKFVNGKQRRVLVRGQNDSILVWWVLNLNLKQCSGKKKN